MPIRFAIAVVVVALLGGTGVLAADSAAVGFPVGKAAALTGQVTTATAPLSQARVYVYQLADLTLSKVVTDQRGGYRFDSLPAGLYKVVAVKAGFVPAVVMLSRTSGDSQQFLDVQLRRPDAEAAAEDFWAVRRRIPADILHDLEVGDSRPDAYAGGLETAAINAKMQAIAGVHEDAAYGETSMTGGSVGVEGRFRDMRFDVAGRFAELGAASFTPDNTSSTGRTQQLSLEFESVGNSTIAVMSQEMSEKPTSVDFERHSIAWSQQVGNKARSDFSAQYTEESNYYRQGPLEAGNIVPAASRSWGVEGSYTTPVTERSSIQAGFRYREREIDYERALDSFSLLPQETVELFGRGGVEIKPAVVVEYGLYSTMDDGSLSLAPQGGVVLRLNSNWQAATTLSHQIHQQDSDQYREDFSPAYYREYDSCARAEEYCYQVAVSRLGKNSEEQFTVGAIHRKISETLRLYFSEDFFNRNDSLFLVQGDRLPELQFGMTRRLAPQVLARVESNVAAGGGGTMLASDSPYENNVRYVVTSMDTQFERSSTGLFVVFHRLEQELSPIHGTSVELPQMELERLKLMVTQDLGLVSSLAADWAVHLDMELSRGLATDHGLDSDELRKRVTGGIAVKF